VYASNIQSKIVKGENLMITKKYYPILLVFLALVLVTIAGNWVSSTVLASPLPQEESPDGVPIPYAGSLVDEEGLPVEDGAYDFTFAIYDADIEGTLLWTETQEDIPVRDGNFVAALVTSDEVLSVEQLWLEIGVRGQQDPGFIPLSPRQPLSSSFSPTEPDSPTAGVACPHDHVGEVWYGNIPWSNAGFTVNNYGNGPSILAWNTGGGNALRGQATGSGLGLYAESETGAGAVGRSTNGHGVEGYSISSGKAGDYAENNAGYGLYARSDSGWGVYCQGDMRVTDNFRVWGTSVFDGYVTFNGGKSGYVVEIAQNDDSLPLERGDVVIISGAGPAIVGDIPLIKVRLASFGVTSAVVGVVDKLYIPSPPASQENEEQGIYADEVVPPGAYLSIVTLGSYQAIKVDASFGAIAPGDLLVASPNPGYAMKATSPAPGAVIGKALDGLTSGVGMIPVIITLQ
jgi:hypothetical protein